MKHALIITFAISILLISFCQCGFSQNNDSLNCADNKYAIIGSLEKGYVYPTNTFFTGVNDYHKKINTFESVSLNFFRQTTGSKDWQILYHYPTYGAGIYTANFHDSKEIGCPIAVYVFFSAPFKRWNKLSFNYDLGLGCAFNWKSYNPINNPYNISIGAKQSAYLNFGMFLEYMIVKRFSASAGLSITHFSNGALKKPNQGINMISPKLSLRYDLYKDGVEFKKKEMPPFEKKNEWLISGYAGAKNVIFDSVNVDLISKYEGESFLVGGFSTSINRQISHRSKIGFGFDVSYDGSHNAQVAIENGKVEAITTPFPDKIEVSVYPSYELVIDRVSVIFQPSFYIVRKKISKETPMFYQRLGVKYYITDNFFAGLSWRAFQFHHSDFLEWNIGYRLDWK